MIPATDVARGSWHGAPPPRRRRLGWSVLRPWLAFVPHLLLVLAAYVPVVDGVSPEAIIPSARVASAPYEELTTGYEVLCSGPPVVTVDGTGSSSSPRLTGDTVNSTSGGRQAAPRLMAHRHHYGLRPPPTWSR